jgi:hypothetical protein
MSYPPVIQFETRALEAEARARLAREQRAARGPAASGRRWLPVRPTLKLLHAVRAHSIGPAIQGSTPASPPAATKARRPRK